MFGALAPTLKKNIIWLALLGLISSLAACDRAPEIGVARLDNGLTIYVIPHHRAPTVTHMVWYGVGGADDPEGHSGIAHLFEHLMFKSTTTRPEGDFSKIIAAMGGQDNAMTMADLTVYFQRVPKERLADVMALEADRMVNLTLSEEDFKTERDVVIEERGLRVDSQPNALAHEKIMDQLYAGHPYHRPVIGWREELENLPYEAATEFYKAHYAPDQAFLLVAGDTSLSEVVRLAKQYYGPLAPSGKKRTIRPALDFAHSTLSPEPLDFSDPRSQQYIWMRYYRLPPSVDLKPRELAALTIGIDLLGGENTSLLYEKLVRGEGVAIATGSALDTNMRNASEVSIYAIAHQREGLTALDGQVDAIIADAQKTLFSPEDIERAANKLAASFVYEQDGQASLAFNYGLAIAFGGQPDDIANWPDYLHDVSPADVQTALATYLKAGQYVTGHIGPADGDANE